MGYQWRRASLDASPEAIEHFRETCEDAEFKLEADGSSEESEGSWYSVDEDLEELSRQFPGETMVMHGEGEEAGDISIFRVYAKGGQVERVAAEVVHPEPPGWFKPWPKQFYKLHASRGHE